MLTVELDSEIPAFLSAVSPALNADPTLHSFLLSLADRTHTQGKKAALLARGIANDGKLEIAGLQTDSTRSLILSLASIEVARDFAHQLQRRVPSLPGVNGPLPTVDAFAEAWSAEKRCGTRVITNLRLFSLRSVTTPSAPSGSWRVAEPKDEDLVVQWNSEFTKEAVPHDPVPSLDELRQRIRDGISKEHYYFWDDNHETVCLVGSTRETSAGRWIAPVYTPKHLRGRGYASGLVAAVSQRHVDLGTTCLLFTDLANPTSNSIYQKVGYRPLADFKHIDFV